MRFLIPAIITVIGSVVGLCDSPGWCGAFTYPEGPRGSAFEEQFDAKQVTGTLFRPVGSRRYWDSWSDGSLVSVADGFLTVSSNVTELHEGRPRVGGAVSAAYYSYGRFTFRARAQLAKGLVAALHLYNEDRDRYAGGRHEEIDIELSSDTPDVVSWDTFHHDNWTNDMHQNTMHRGDFAHTHDPDDLQDFDNRQLNVYAVKWKPDSVRWFVNGVKIAEATQAIPTIPLAIRFDLYHNRQWDQLLGLRPSSRGALEVDSVCYEPWHNQEETPCSGPRRLQLATVALAFEERLA